MGKKKSTTKTEPWKAAQPYIMSGGETIQGNQANLQANAGAVNSLIPSLMERFNNPNPLTIASQNYAGDVLGGKYLTGNPYLEDMIGQTGDSVSDRVNSLFGGAGRTGGSQHVGMLTSELADAENRLRFGDYSSERDRMGQSAALAPSLTAADYQSLSPLMSAAQLGGTLPLAGPQAIGSLFGPYTQTQQKQPWGPMVLDAAASAAMAFSDRRLKADVEAVGVLDDGLTVYDFRYHWDEPETRRRGVMADDVAMLRPWALGPEVGGFATVNYEAI